MGKEPIVQTGPCGKSEARRRGITLKTEDGSSPRCAEKGGVTNSTDDAGPSAVDSVVVGWKSWG